MLHSDPMIPDRARPPSRGFSARGRTARRWRPRGFGALVPPALLALAAAPLAGCQTVGYYSQAVGGHLALMRAREPIDELLEDDATDPELRAKLETLLEARRFAVEELALPDTDSYRTYVETGRRYVTWNVVAAPEFSLSAHTWCFPVAGCVSYRGYYAEEDARAYADEFAEEGFDVAVGGASAYSTLGWFDDPVLDTMLRGGELRYVGTLFHEMAHQRFYVQDDSDFNEAYATFVEREGVRRWLASRGQEERLPAYEAALARGADFAELLAGAREALVALYGQDLGEAAMRAAKAEAFDAMRADYEALKASWDGYAGYDGWFARELNNARLVAVSTYRRRVPAFAALFELEGRDLERFHEAVEALGEMTKAERTARLDELAAMGERETASRP